MLFKRCFQRRALKMIHHLHQSFGFSIEFQPFNVKSTLVFEKEPSSEQNYQSLSWFWFCEGHWNWNHIFLNNVTALISEQFLESWSDHLSHGKLGKHILQQTLILTFDTIVFLCIKHAPERPQITIKHFPWKYYIIILSCWPPMVPFR